MIGKIFVPGVAGPYRHPRVWLREPTEERERLRIGVGIDTIKILRTLAAVLAEPLYVLVVMRAPRKVEAGRWQTPAITYEQFKDFTDRWGELFEDDPRAQLWVGELEGVGLLVLDEHDLIYAYGPLHRFEQVLRSFDYSTGDPAVPNPHEHRYNYHFDELESELRRTYAWEQILPLDAAPED